MKLTIKALIASAALISANSASAVTLVKGTFGAIEAGSTLYANYDTVTPAPTASSFSFVYPPSGGPGRAVPVDGVSKFLSVLGGGFTTYSFAGGRSSFSLDVGSIDQYNSITVRLLGGTSKTFWGATFGDIQSKARLIFNADAAERITGVTLRSSTNSLEVDNLALGGAVPEPATWAMMIGGVGMVGGAMRRRRGTTAGSRTRLA